jgi:uncharacterized membrane protein
MAAHKSSKAWGVASKSEPRWPASLAVLIAAALNFALPARYSMGPSWLEGVLVVVILIPLMVAAPRRVPEEGRWQQLLAVVPIAIVNVFNVASLILLIRELVTDSKNVTGSHLLVSALAIWVTNVIVFALWYWELDRGGPDDRMRESHAAPDLLFPQMITPGCGHPDWTPGFLDYLYVAFTNSTAFSPTDTFPLTPWAKTLFTVQAVVSLVAIAIVASRAVNIL